MVPFGKGVRMIDEIHGWFECVFTCAVLSLFTSNFATSTIPHLSAAITAAIEDHARPATDTARDANRKPADTLAFTGIKAGDKVADYAAGAGYFTRLFAGVVGPSGHVYASVPAPLFKYPNIV